MSAYVHWIKPRLLSTSAPRGGKSLLLHLCARSRILIPIIVFTAFWATDLRVQLEATISFSLNHSVRVTLGPDDAEPDQFVDDNDEDDGIDDDDLLSIDSYTDDYSSASEASLFGIDEVESALQEFVEYDTIHTLTLRLVTVYSV